MMSTPNDDLLSAFDGHDVAALKRALAAGADPSTTIKGKLATEWLLEEYTRSDELVECLRLIVERGAVFRDPAIAGVVLNDPAGIRLAFQEQPDLVHHRTTLKSAFTSLREVSLLHVAAEFGHLAAARELLALGVDVNSPAGCDEWGMNGHTPIFHTVNSHGNRSAPVMNLLLEAGARSDITLTGLHWGEEYAWHTVFFDVTPVSYAMFGLLPQVTRDEVQIMENVTCLLRSAGRAIPPLDNVPNRYLRKSH